jgi:hypothetical protein
MFLARFELLPRGCTSWPFVRTQGACITLLVQLRNLILERRRLKNNGKKSRLRMEEKWKMEEILVKMEKMEKWRNL